jgi:protein-arginine deiminase
MTVVFGYPPELYGTARFVQQMLLVRPHSAIYQHSKMHVRRMIHLISTATAYSTKSELPADKYPNHDIRIVAPSGIHGKAAWTKNLCAYFLPNIGDTNRRCSNITQELEQSTEDLWKCHDASDDMQRAPKCMTPLRTHTLPNLLDTATATISVPDARQRQFVRIFQQVKEEWVIVSDV